MIDCISVENMRQSDAYTISKFVPSLELMHRAAYGVFKHVSWQGRIAILTGSGNNGGDGYALACILHDHGYASTVYTLGRKLSDDSRFYAQKADALGVTVMPFTPDCKLSGYDIIVDCLLGTGFQGEVRVDYRSAIERINTSGAYVVSVDINSGMHGDTGEGTCFVKSDLTVTIGYVKNGLISENAGKGMKRLVCADIGIRLLNRENRICTPSEWAELCEKEGIAETEKKISLDGCIYFRRPEWLEM